MEKGKNLKLFSGNGNRPFAERVAAYLGIQLGEVEVGRHPGGEVRVQYGEDVRGSHVVIIQPTGAPETNLREVKLMINAARSSNAGFVTIANPYYGYGRSDWKSRARVSIAARVVADELIVAGLQHIIGLDFHALQIHGFFDVRFCTVDHLFGLPVFVGLFRQLGLTDRRNGPPDASRGKTAEAYERRLGGGMFFSYKKKENDRAKEVTIVGDVRGHKVRISDDIISTGSTMKHAAETLRDQGAIEIDAVATHGEFCDDWEANLIPAPIDRFYLGDSLPIAPDVIEKLGDRLVRVTLAPLFGEAIKRFHCEESFEPLFDDEHVAKLYGGNYVL